MVLDAPGRALRSTEIPDPVPADGEVLVRIHACGVCRTDLHVVDGELRHPKLPLVPGHQIVGTVVETGAAVETLAPGDRVGIPWLGWTCGECRFCLSGRENLCDRARFTGYQLDGGYAELTVADHRFCFPIPTEYPDLAGRTAPLRGPDRLPLAHDGRRRGTDRALRLRRRSPHRDPGRALAGAAGLRDSRRRATPTAQRFAVELGAEWAGDSFARPPEELDAAIIFAPAGELVPAALRAVAKGGTVVCAGIHMSDLPSFPYELLWGERIDPIGGEPDAARRRGIPRPRPAGADQNRGRAPTRWRRRTRRSEGFAAGEFEAARLSSSARRLPDPRDRRRPGRLAEPGQAPCVLDRP